MTDKMQISSIELQNAETMLKQLVQEAEVEEISKAKVQAVLETLGDEFCKAHEICTPEKVADDGEEFSQIIQDVQEALKQYRSASAAQIADESQLEKK